MSAVPSGLSGPLYQYMLANSLREPPLVAELRARSDELEQGRWRTSPEQCQFMALLARIAGVRRYLEVGTFTGYGALWMALSLPADGEVVTCDLVDDFARIGQPFWQRAGMADKIVLKIAPALETLDGLLAEGGADGFDMAFIDADKQNYPAYYERCFELVRPGGLILIDNVFWGGAVVDDTVPERSSVRAIREVTARVRDDDRVDISLVPIADGLTIARKKP